MVRPSGLFAGLVMALTARATPIAQTNTMAEDTGSVDPVNANSNANLGDGLIDINVKNTPQECSLELRDPASWEVSGGKLLLEEYLRANGSCKNDTPLPLLLPPLNQTNNV
jgi:hypothetical protein